MLICPVIFVDPVAPTIKVLLSWKFNSSTILQAKFRIHQQKFIEQLSMGHANEALSTLRNEIAPLQINVKEVKRLSGTVS